MKCYHHNDADGRCAGAIVYRAMKEKYSDIEMIEVSYKDEIDIEKIKLMESIYIVDFSFKPEIMNKVLEKTAAITWIDHHKTAFEYGDQYDQGLEGIRSNDESGCMLTWNYFYPMVPVPLAVTLIDDYDRWALTMEGSEPFINGLRLVDHGSKAKIWQTLLADNLDYTEGIVSNGWVVMRYRDNFCADYRKSFAFEVEFEGYKCLACGIYMFASKLFGEEMKKYDICISFEYDGKGWTVGLYSEKIDVGKIAKDYGGGGHKGAAGYVTKDFPF